MKEGFYALGRPEKDPSRRRLWTHAYIDQAGKGLMVTCAAPVYDGDAFGGTIAIDLTVDRLRALTERFPVRAATVFLVNDRAELLAHPRLVHSYDAEVKRVDVALPGATPEQIKALFDLEPLAEGNVGGRIFLQYPLKNVPWRVVLLAPVRQIALTRIIDSSIAFAAFMAGLTAMLVITNRTTRKDIIEPAQQLVTHIEKVSQNAEHPIPEVPVGWHRWFATISNIFRENHVLVEELKTHNEQLDSLVAQRTQELRRSNDQLQSTLAQLKDAQEQIILQEKMASLGELTAGIAHEIKTPLNFVNNFAELSGELIQEIKDIVEAQSDRLEPDTKADFETSP